jgi:hypothetical protein
MRTSIAILLLVVAAFSVRADEPTTVDTRGWKTIPGGPGSGCAAEGSPYEFYVHEADPKRIAVYFQGGGGCWNNRNCGLEGQRTFEPTVDDGDKPWLKYGTGIFDVTHADNPLREFTLVLATYCTADVHLGVRTGRFETADGKRLDVQFRGLANAQSVTDWLTTQYPDPKVIFVTGGSAGAIASPVFASQLARHYERARVVQLGDGAGGYRTARLAPLLELWGATRALKNDLLFRDLDVTQANFEDFYVRAAPVKNLQLAQVNSVEDAVMLFFLGQLGHQAKQLAPLLSGNLAELRRADPDLRTYTMPGVLHEVLRRPEFYTTTVDGVPLTKWVQTLVEGKRVENVGESLLVPAAERLQ